MVKSITTTPKTSNVRRLNRRIGQTTYRVGIHMSRTSNETIDDKIIRLIRYESEHGKESKK